MSATKALNGFRPSRKRGGASNSTAQNVYDIASGYSANIFSGDPVVLVAGKVNVMTGDTDRILGVFAGCEYEANGVPTFSAYWPSGTSATNAKAYVLDDPSQLYVVQADASITAGDIGELNFGVTLGAGSTEPLVLSMNPAILSHLHIQRLKLGLSRCLMPLFLQLNLEGELKNVCY